MDLTVESSPLDRHFKPLWGNRATAVVLTTTLAMLLSPALLGAQSSAVNQPCGFEGEVVSAAGGDPIAGARVIAQSPASASEAMTDGAGHFCIGSVAAGQYHILIERKGFVNTYYGENLPFRVWQVFSVSTSSAFSNLVIRLLPAAQIDGHVYDENGDPFQGVRVEAVRELWRGGRLHLETSHSSETNDQGDYKIDGLAPDNYLLFAVAHSNPPRQKGNSHKDRESSEDVAYVPFFYPASVEFRGAGVVNLRPGDDRGPFDFHLHPTSAYSLKGEISAPNLPKGRHEAVEIAIVPLNPDAPDYDLHRRQLSFKQSSFVIHGILPGSYDLIASTTAKQETYSGRVTVTVGESDVDGLRLILGPNFDLTGRVTVNGNSAVKASDLRVALSTKLPQVWSDQYTEVNPGGIFTFKNIFEGPASINISGCRNCYVKSLTLGGDSYPPSRIEITRESASAGLLINIGTDGAQVTGTVVDSNQKPAASAYVVIVPATPSTLNQGFYRTAFTDGRGQFGVAGLPAGDYQIFAWPSPQGAAFEDPAFIEQHREDGFSVTLMSGQIRNIQIRLLPPSGGS
ncbi:MAG TPA: carboxypeptidase-like regulatory domain-containing protein [Terriglobia bacterium]|nr:carboxypeptidase-like regulatory domain-containing protein [Terriglobia bacterium]